MTDTCAVELLFRGPSGPAAKGRVLRTMNDLLLRCRPVSFVSGGLPVPC